MFTKKRNYVFYSDIQRRIQKQAEIFTMELFTKIVKGFKGVLICTLSKTKLGILAMVLQPMILINSEVTDSQPSFVNIGVQPAI